MQVEIIEVGPRDGLQNERVFLSPAERVHLIAQLVAAGAKRIEAVSFVPAHTVPAMAGAEQVMAAVPRGDGVSYAGLVLNRRGVDRAIAAGVDEVNVVVCASDTMSRRNQNASTQECLAMAGDVVSVARAEGLRTTLTVATAFGCAFEGLVPPDAVAAIASTARGFDVDELCLADSVGMGVPAQVDDLVERLSPEWGTHELRFHFHNTRNTGYANAIAALASGVTRLDSSIGGIGGCPFAPRATGNIATEDLLYLLERSGMSTTWNAESLSQVGDHLSAQLGKPLPSMLRMAGRAPLPSGVPA